MKTNLKKVANDVKRFRRFIYDESQQEDFNPCNPFYIKISFNKVNIAWVYPEIITFMGADCYIQLTQITSIKRGFYKEVCYYQFLCAGGKRVKIFCFPE